MKATSLFAGAALLLVITLLGSCRNQAIAQGMPMTQATAAALPAVVAQSSHHDFDFLIGTWEMKNRRLKYRHAQSDEWDEFPGRFTMRTILRGIGNIDDVDFPTKGWSGVSMRFFNPQMRQWSIYWVNSRDGLMQAPVVGHFTDGVGEFFGDDMDEGRPVYVRYRWTRTDTANPHWEQAFSLDGGKTWETNWTIDLKRVP